MKYFQNSDYTIYTYIDYTRYNKVLHQKGATPKSELIIATKKRGIFRVGVVCNCRPGSWKIEDCKIWERDKMKGSLVLRSHGDRMRLFSLNLIFNVVNW